ncbi:MAG: organomercurial lyase [Acidimicrobiales bacterium]
MDERDVAVRNVTYHLFVDRGRAPTNADVATAAGASADEIRASWRRLHDAHAIVLHPGTSELRMANPFSAVASAFRVHAGGRSWYANCAWDAFGICAALHVDGRIETVCADCDEAIECEIRAARPSDESLLFHCLVPASAWWDDIVFT